MAFLGTPETAKVASSGETCTPLCSAFFRTKCATLEWPFPENIGVLHAEKYEEPATTPLVHKIGGGAGPVQFQGLWLLRFLEGGAIGSGAGLVKESFLSTFEDGFLVGTVPPKLKTELEKKRVQKWVQVVVHPKCQTPREKALSVYRLLYQKKWVQLVVHGRVFLRFFFVQIVAKNETFGAPGKCQFWHFL